MRISFKKISRNYFNPRAPCGARRQQEKNTYFQTDISIHGLRVEPDFDVVVYKAIL